MVLNVEFAITGGCNVLSYNGRPVNRCSRCSAQTDLAFDLCTTACIGARICQCFTRAAAGLQSGNTVLLYGDGGAILRNKPLKRVIPPAGRGTRETVWGRTAPTAWV